MSVIPMLDRPNVSDCFHEGKSKTYQRIEKKLLPPPVKHGRRSLWPADEIVAVQKAVIAGRSEAEIRSLVNKLVAARATADQAA